MRTIVYLLQKLYERDIIFIVVIRNSDLRNFVHVYNKSIQYCVKKTYRILYVITYTFCCIIIVSFSLSQFSRRRSWNKFVVELFSVLQFFLNE